MEPKKTAVSTSPKASKSSAKTPDLKFAKETLQQTMVRVKKIDQVLSRTYPDARCTLDFKNPLELLVATILAAQSTDMRVNIITRKLFKKYRSAEDYAQADPQVVQQDITSAGFFRNKTKSVIGCAQALVERYNSRVPQTMEDLLTLPGVGRKTANVILGNVFGIPGIVVDTHVGRLSGRLGLSKQHHPEKIEQDLMKLLPPERWTMFSHLLVFHGRHTCTARKPQCSVCPINALCPSAFRV